MTNFLKAYHDNRVRALSLINNVPKLLHLHDHGVTNVLFWIQWALHNGRLHRTGDNYIATTKFRLSFDSNRDGDARVLEHVSASGVWNYIDYRAGECYELDLQACWQAQESL